MNQADQLIITEVKRAEGIREAEPPKNFLKQRLAKIAYDLSLTGDATAKTLVINESVLSLINLLYEDSGAGLENIDSVTNRILRPVPWGESGCKLWGLRRLEASVLRKALVNRQKSYENAKAGKSGGKSVLAPLFVQIKNFWYLNVLEYPNVEIAQRWQMVCQVTAKEFLALSGEIKAKNLDRVNRSRANRTRR